MAVARSIPLLADIPTDWDRTIDYLIDNGIIPHPSFMTCPNCNWDGLVWKGRKTKLGKF